MLVEHQQRVVDVVAVVAVKQSELQLAVSDEVGRIEVEHDARWMVALFGPSSEPLDPEIEQQVGKAERFATGALLEAGQSGLRGQARAVIAGSAAEGDLEGGIVTKGVGVGGVFIAGADLQYVLEKQITGDVADLAACRGSIIAPARRPESFR